MGKPLSLVSMWQILTSLSQIDGCFSYCFMDTTLYPLLFAYLVVALVVRTYQVFNTEPNKDPLMPRLGLRLIIGAILSALSLVLLAGRFLDSTLVTYDILRLSLMALSWFAVITIFSFEASRNLASTAWMQLYVIAAFSISVVRLQTVQTLPAPFHWEVVFTYLEIFFTLILACLTWLVNGEADKLKVAASEDIASQELATINSGSGPISEEAPLLATKSAGKDDERLNARRGHPTLYSPEETANIFSRMIFGWANPLYRKGSEKALEEAELWPLIDADKSVECERVFNLEYEKELRKPVDERSLKRALWRAFGAEFMIGGLYKLINDTLVFAGPLLLNLLIRFLDTPEWPVYYGVIFGLGLFLASMIQTIAVGAYFFRVTRIGQRMRSTLIPLVYQKAFDISNRGRQQYTTGEITNLMSVDSTRLQTLTPYLHMMWSAPLQISVSMYLLYQQIGPSVFVGLGFMILMVPLNAVLMKRLSKFQKDMMVNKDRRLKLMSEILGGIRIIKFFAWEESYIDSANEVRQQEVDTLRKSAYIRATTSFSWAVTPTFVALFTFMSFSLLGHELTASIAFTSVALFNVLRFPLNMLPFLISNLVDANISLNRISNYLNNDNRDPDIIEWRKKGDPMEPMALQMIDGTFSWIQGEPTLKNLTFEVPKGKLVALVGGVGSGKSSILSAFLGDMEKESGRAILDGSLAYASQQAWIQNATVRDNILFGLPYQATRYRQTLDACQLQSDLEILQDGDETQIGEKGINLSGGQKQRISLARAVYANKDIYLLDDVLSAVDVHVGRSLFDGVLRGALSGKTVFIVTHQLQYLPEVDGIIVVREGEIQEQGTYKELMAKKGSFYNLISEFVLGGKDSHDDVSSSNNNNEEGGDLDLEIDDRDLLKASMKGAQEAVIAKETKKVLASLGDGKQAPKEKAKANDIMGVKERERGRLNSDVFFDYMVASGGVAFALFILGLLLVASGSNVGTNIWLSSWSDDAGLLQHPLVYWLGIYTALGVISGITTWLRALLTAQGGVAASMNLHKSLLRRIMRAPTGFFDSTPMGRILNRFSGDIYIIDENLPNTLSSLFSMLFASIAVLLVISFVTPLFLIFVFPLGYV